MEAERLIKYLVPMGLVVIAFGTVGYSVLEGVGLFEALYMTIITITTVGFGEIIPLDDVGRVFTIVLIVFGYSYLVMTFMIVAQVVFEGRMRRLLGRRKLTQQIDRLERHNILCGYGRMGRIIARELKAKSAPLVVIDAHEDATRELDELGILYVQGNATEDDTLIEAGIQRAKTLIVSLATDADAVFTILLARELNPNLEIVARAIDERSTRQLEAAGATRVVSPYTRVGKSMANAVLHPEVLDFLDTAFMADDRTLRMEGCPVSEASELAGKTLRDAPIRTKLGLIIIGIRKADGTMLFNPSPDDAIIPGDILIAMGDEENLEKLQKWLNPEDRH
ncbi:MAG: potassium channel protein [Deltaproteobacteria bacterium]|nr:potassium channel protein [Deltaproteobacteria bacterium]